MQRNQQCRAKHFYQITKRQAKAQTDQQELGMAILTVQLQQQQAQLLVMKIVLLIIKLTLAACFGFIHSIHANPPGLSRSLPDMTPISRSPVRVTIISRIKSSFELFCALARDQLEMLAQNLNFSYSQYGFWGTCLVTDKDYFWDQMKTLIANFDSMYFM